MKKRTNTRKPRSAKPLAALPGIALASLVACLAPSVYAGNVLQNPGFETGSGLVDWSAREDQSWPIGPGNGQGKLYHGGNNSLWMQGEYGNPAPDLIYEYQTIACAPGSTFTADAFFSQYVQHDNTVGEGGDNGSSGVGLFTADGSGQEDGWVEVAFMDAGNHILADYRSVIIDPAYEANLVTAGATTTVGAQTILTWLHCQVTNQYDVSQIPAGVMDPDSYASAITNTLAPGQYMTAPAGTAKVQYRLALYQSLYESGATYWDDATLNLVGGPAPSVVSNVNPDGSHFFNSFAGGFTFTVTSASSGGAQLPNNPTNNIKVSVNGADQSSSLQFSGNLQNWNVTLPTITSNALYNITITVSNTAGLVTTHAVTFDTFNTNAFVVYAEDYDFNGGMYIPNPIPTNAPDPNSYWGTAGTAGIDYNYAGGGSTLVPNYPNRTDGAVDFQLATDLPMPFYAAQSNSAIYNVNISYNNGGNWLNYTRNPYPQGVSVIFARISGGNGYGVEHLNLLTSGYGTSSQTTTNLGDFVLQNGTDWGSYKWIPLTDPLGNLAVVNIPAGLQTLQLLSGGGENVIDFLIVPAGGVAIPPVIANFVPAVNTQGVFLGGTTNLSFTISSSSSTVASSNITVTLNGSAAPASFTGNNTNWTVSIALPQNQVISLGISAKDARGQTATLAESFDTFYQTNFMVEAEDFDFNNGQYIDNPVAAAAPESDSYYYFPKGDSGNTAVPMVDFITTASAGEQYNYRVLDLTGTDVSMDYLRQKFSVNSANDYYIGWWTAGAWQNYTRTYPTGHFRIWGRLAGGGGPYTGLTLSQVTSGQGTSNQITQILGTFSDPGANGWQSWHWIPLLDTNDQPVTVSLNGVETLRATSAGGANANYFMLVPVSGQPSQPHLSAASTVQGQFVIRVPTQNGFSYTVLYNNSLTGGTWQPLGTSFPGTGGTVSVTNAPSQTARFFKVMAQ